MMETDNAPQKDSTEAKVILIVEDDEAIGEFLLQAIQLETHYQVALAKDGFQALQMLQTLKANLIILDYNLPDTNGLRLYDTFHAVEALKHIPALIVSIEATYIQKEVEARQLPFLKKPFELVDLLEAIEQFFTSP
jgi:CheY-like chemotaxis protein